MSTCGSDPSSMGSGTTRPRRSRPGWCTSTLTTAGMCSTKKAQATYRCASRRDPASHDAQYEDRMLTVQLQLHPQGAKAISIDLHPDESGSFQSLFEAALSVSAPMQPGSI
jgi:hypothetical protein